MLEDRLVPRPKTKVASNTTTYIHLAEFPRPTRHIITDRDRQIDKGLIGNFVEPVNNRNISK